MEFNGSQYPTLLGSDVANDGTYMELQDPSGKVIAFVFRSDLNGSFEVETYAEEPAQLIKRFIEKAKQQLAQEAAV
jgi:hypothetical protein